MKVLVIGGSGLVGSALITEWARRGATVSATSMSHPTASAPIRLDMRDPGAVREVLASARPDIIAVPAANPYVDYCELHPDETRALNVAGTINVAEAAAAARRPMIFFSSDYVFDGRKESYGEEDAPNPINEYGRQKLAVERAVLCASPSNLVIRASGVYGWEERGRNFVEQVLRRLSSRQRMNVAVDLFYNPTAVEDLAAAVADAVALKASGVYHVAGHDRIGRHAFAVAIANTFKLPAELLKPVEAASLSSPTPRPRSTSLRTDKITRLIKRRTWGVRDGLERMALSKAR